MCDWSPPDYGDWETLFDGTKRARRHMKCDECGGRITKRSRYNCVIGSDEDGETTINTCRPCKRVYERFTEVHGDCPPFMMLGETLGECIDREEDEIEYLKDGDETDEEIDNARAAIVEWSRALVEMNKRAAAAKAVQHA